MSQEIQETSIESPVRDEMFIAINFSFKPKAPLGAQLGDFGKYGQYIHPNIPAIRVRGSG
jgi:hypothetical protein